MTEAEPKKIPISNSYNMTHVKKSKTQSFYKLVKYLFQTYLPCIPQQTPQLFCKDSWCFCQPSRSLVLKGNNILFSGNKEREMYYGGSDSCGITGKSLEIDRIESSKLEYSEILPTNKESNPYCDLKGGLHEIDTAWLFPFIFYGFWSKLPNPHI